MKKVIFTELKEDTILLNKINETEPIFAVRNGVIRGMLIKEVIEEEHNEDKKEGWIVKIGKNFGSRGYFPTRESAMQAETETDFYIEIEIKQ